MGSQTLKVLAAGQQKYLILLQNLLLFPMPPPIHKGQHINQSMNPDFDRMVRFSQTGQESIQLEKGLRLATQFPGQKRPTPSKTQGLFHPGPQAPSIL